MTAVIALGFKSIVIPVALRRMVVRMESIGTIETVGRHRPDDAAGIGLVALSMEVMLRVTAAPIRWPARTWRLRFLSCSSGF